MANDCMLTTFDNPYDPFEQFTLWWLFDKQKGYNSCERLASLIQPHITSDMTDKEIDEITENAIDELIKIDFLNVFTKAFRNISA